MTFRIPFTYIGNCIMHNKTAIIVWVWGQDGKIMRNFLKAKNYNIIWISKEKTSYHGTVWWEIHIDILDIEQIKTLINIYKPDEIYYLAAHHHSSQDIIDDNILLFEKSYNIHVKWYLNFLEAIKKKSPQTKIFYASSSLIFWWTQTEIQDENTIPCPNSIYGITKLDWIYLGKLYRENYNIFASSGILYNHESEYRSPKFITMKIIQWALDIKNWKSDKLIIWNLSAKVDRWYAYDYVEGMHMILQHNKPEDFVISSGKIHTVQEFIEIVFYYLWLDWREYVMEEKNIIQRKNWILLGDASKIMKDIGWVPHTWFKEMIISIIKKFS